MAEHDNASPKRRGLSPLVIAAAVMGTALVARQAYRYLGLRHRRPKWKSKSRHAQISRWESEGGNVPEVQPLEPDRVRH